MKKIALIIAGMLLTVYATSQAKTVVVMDTDGTPVIAASVMDRKGVNIGVTDTRGHITVSDNSFPLSVRALGLETTSVDAATDTVVMPWKPVAMDEVVVSSQSRPVARIVCYMRETSGMIVNGDTTRLVLEGMVDFLIPVGKTKYKGRNFARMLNRRYTITSTTEQIDTADVVSNLTFYVISSYPRSEFHETGALAGRTSGTDTVRLSKKGVVAILHTKTPAGYRVYSDFLADKKNHVWSPLLLKLIGATVDVHEFAVTELYGGGNEGLHTPLDLKAMTVTAHILCRGKWIRKALGATGDADTYTHIEFYPVDTSFLTEQEAREIDRQAPRQEFIFPATLE